MRGKVGAACTLLRAFSFCACAAACHSHAGAKQSVHASTAMGAAGEQPSRASVGASALVDKSRDLQQAPCNAPYDHGVRLIGRYDGCKPGGPRMSWSGSGFVARFSGTGLSVTLDGGELIFTTLVDGVVTTDLVTGSGKATYVLAAGLRSGEHTLELYRQGEPSFGPSVLHGVSVTDGELLPPPAAATRRIEMVGDSITAGYGNEGTSPACPFSAETENHYLTYGAIMARALGADLSTVAWSGKGVVSNYGGNRVSPMPQLYERAEPGDEHSVWDFSLWQPHAVVVNLGTNDYSTDNDPSDNEFVSAYAQLLTNIRARYPEASIICTLGPLLLGTDLEKAEANIAAAVQKRKAAGDTGVLFQPLRVANVEPGCDWHPGLLTHRLMAEALEPVMRSALNW